MRGSSAGLRAQPWIPSNEGIRPVNSRSHNPAVKRTVPGKFCDVVLQLGMEASRSRIKGFVCRVIHRRSCCHARLLLLVCPILIAGHC